MNFKWAIRTLDRSGSLHRRLHVEDCGQTDRFEAWLWGIALLTFGVGDIVTTCLGQHLGLVEGNPVLRTLFEIGPVPLVISVATLGQLGLAYAITSRLSRPIRLLIPAFMAVLGIRVVLINASVIGSLP